MLRCTCLLRSFSYLLSSSVFLEGQKKLNNFKNREKPEVAAHSGNSTIKESLEGGQPWKKKHIITLNF